MDARVYGSTHSVVGVRSGPFVDRWFGSGLGATLQMSFLGGHLKSDPSRSIGIDHPQQMYIFDILLVKPCTDRHLSVEPGIRTKNVSRHTYGGGDFMELNPQGNVALWYDCSCASPLPGS